MAVEPPVLASALLAACAVIATTGTAPVLQARPGVMARVATLAPATSVRLQAEAAWFLDPQLCLQAFVWFHAGAWSAIDELGTVRCWR